VAPQNSCRAGCAWPKRSIPVPSGCVGKKLQIDSDIAQPAMSRRLEPGPTNITSDLNYTGVISPGVVLIYTPRDEAEYEICRTLSRTSYRSAVRRVGSKKFE
jgi:hypothetical protein